MKTIVLYNSMSGNTKAVSEYIASKTDGVAVKLRSKDIIELGEYANVYIGCMVHGGKLTKTVAKFIEKNKDLLAKKNAKYFVCCSYNDAKGNKQMMKIMERYGLPNCVFFSKGKKIIANGGEEIDKFINP